MADKLDRLEQQDRPDRLGALRGVRPLVDLCGCVTTLAYLWLAWASYSPPIPLVPFFFALALAWIALALLFLRLRSDTGPFPLRRVILWCLLFRAIGLAAEPVFEDDHYRYLWDGRSFALTGSPYGDAPADHFADPAVTERFERVLDGINNPDLPTIYPPAAQYLFLAGYWIAPGSFAAIKLLLMLADLGCLILLFKLAGPRGALIYAWCPLVIQEVAFTGHVDTLGVFFLVAAIYAHTRGRWMQVALYAALALATKLLAILILPFLMLRLRRAELSVFAPLAKWPIFLGVLALLYLPLTSSVTPGGLAGLASFLAEWEFNSMLFALLAALGGPVFAKLVGAAFVVSLCGALLYRENASRDGGSAGVPRGDWLFACFFLFAPVVNPWYLLWMLPFVCVYPSAWGLAALAAVSLSYAHGLFLPDSSLPPYHHPSWLRPLELGIVAACALLAHSRASYMGSALWARIQASSLASVSRG